MIIIYIDIILLVILLCLTLFTCGYCFYRVYTMQRNGQVQILLRPRKVLFSHKKEGETNDELRTVVAYRNPFTGDYCVRKGRESRGYANPRQTHPAGADLDSPDSGLSDEYEPLSLEPAHVPRTTSLEIPDGEVPKKLIPEPPLPKRNGDNSLIKTWNWNYTEYQI